MNLGLVFSVLLHAGVVALAVFGLPRLARDEPIENRLIVVDVVTVAEVTNAPPPAEQAKPDKTPPPPPEAAAEPDRAPPPPPPQAAAPPPPPPPPQVAARPETQAPPPKPEPAPVAEAPPPEPAAEAEPVPMPAEKPEPPEAEPEPAPMPVPVEKPEPPKPEPEPAQQVAAVPPPEAAEPEPEKPEAAEVQRVEPEPEPEAATPVPVPVARPTPPERPRRAEASEAPKQEEEKKKDDFLSVLKTVQDLKKDTPRPETNDERSPVPDAETTARRSSFDPNQTLSVSELDAIRQQISGCWLVPAGAKNAADLVVEIEVTMNSDRTVRSARVVDQSRMLNDPFFRSAAESALRALRTPKCSPLQLPPEKYDTWKSFTITFDPKDMLS